MTDEPTPPEPPRINRKEVLWLGVIVLIVSTMIWLATAEVWGTLFSVEETEVPSEK